jgi:hypothetical protein
MKATNSRDIKSRTEIADTIDRCSADLNEKTIDLAQLHQDVQTVRDTLANLDLAGTTEGSDSVKQAVATAEATTTDIFGREDEKLEQTQTEGAEFEQELQEHSEAERADIETLSEASRCIRTDETINELVKAKEAALNDIDFLLAQIERAKTARDKSEAAQQEYRRTIQTPGGQGV